MEASQITHVLSHPTSQELPGRAMTRKAYVAKDGTPRSVPIGFVWNGPAIVVTPTWAKLIDFETPSAAAELIQHRAERQRA